MRKNWITAALVAAAFMLPAMSADAYTVKGMGECSTWVGGEDDRFWILGFLSGANWADDANYARGVDPDDIYKFVSKYCGENPDHDLADATVAWIKIH